MPSGVVVTVGGNEIEAAQATQNEPMPEKSNQQQTMPETAEIRQNKSKCVCAREREKKARASRVPAMVAPHLPPALQEGGGCGGTPSPVGARGSPAKPANPAKASKWRCAAWKLPRPPQKESSWSHYPLGLVANGGARVSCQEGVRSPVTRSGAEGSRNKKIIACEQEVLQIVAEATAGNLPADDALNATPLEAMLICLRWTLAKKEPAGVLAGATAAAPYIHPSALVLVRRTDHRRHGAEVGRAD